MEALLRAAMRKEYGSEIVLVEEIECSFFFSRDGR